MPHVPIGHNSSEDPQCFNLNLTRPLQIFVSSSLFIIQTSSGSQSTWRPKEPKSFKHSPGRSFGYLRHPSRFSRSNHGFSRPHRSILRRPVRSTNPRVAGPENPGWRSAILGRSRRETCYHFGIATKAKDPGRTKPSANDSGYEEPCVDITRKRVFYGGKRLGTSKYTLVCYCD